MFEPMSITSIIFMIIILIKRQAENTLITKGQQKIIIDRFRSSMRTVYTVFIHSQNQLHQTLCSQLSVKF